MSLAPLLVVLRSRRLRRLLAAYLVFNAAEWATWIALLVWAYGEGGVTATAVVAVVQLIPAVPAALLGAVLGDRMPRRRALALGYGLQAVSMLATAVALAVDAPFAVVAAAGAATTCAIALTRPVHHALLPAIASSPEELTAANAASTVVEGVAALVGSVGSGAAVVLWGAESVFAVFGLLSVGSAVLVGTVGAASPGAGAPPGRHDPLVRAAVGGLVELRRDAGASALVVLAAAQYVVLGLLDVLTVALALDVLDTSAAGPGVLAGALGAGGLLGAAASSVLAGSRHLLPVLWVGLVVSSAALAVTGVAPTLLVGAVLLALSGAGKSLVDVSARTLLQRAVPDDVLARVFGVQESVLTAGAAVGSAVAPLLVSLVGVPGAYLVTGGLLPVAAALVARPLRRVAARAADPPAALADLRAVPMLRVLPVTRLERLALSASQVDVPAGAAVVREGESGDRYYLVRHGTAQVRRGGRVVRRLGPGEGFGEIALLRAVPRTADVLAEPEGPDGLVLWAVEREDFLAAVGGSRRGWTSVERRTDQLLAEDRAREEN